MTGWRWAFVVVILLFVGLTNQWRSWSDAISYSQSYDVYKYEQIARDAPAFPAEPITLHHAQRFTIHYLAGLTAKVIGFSNTYRLFWALLTLLLVLACDRLLLAVRLPPPLHLACLGLFLLSPYTLRYYALAFGMIQDQLFMLGTFLVAIGLLEAKLAMLVLGACVAVVGRQTAVMLFPGIALWVYFGEAWATRTSRQRLIAIAAPCATIVAAYVVLSLTVRSFSLPSRNIEHVTAIFSWMLSPEFSVRPLAELLVRAAIPFALPVAVLVGFGDPKALKRVELAACVLFVAAIAAQPVLAGPVITGRNASRLAALGFAFAVAGVALAVRDSKAAAHRVVAGLILGAAVATSWHHLYTVVGPSSAGQFAAIQVAIAAAVACAGWALRSRLPRCTNEPVLR